MRENTNHGRSAVYDLTVEGEHEFFANGILVHNCRYIAMARPYLPDRTEPSNETELEKMVREDQERGDNQDLDHEFGAVYS